MLNTSDTLHTVSHFVLYNFPSAEHFRQSTQWCDTNYFEQQNYENDALTPGYRILSNML
jgi:hypothetical protein